MKSVLKIQNTEATHENGIETHGRAGDRVKDYLIGFNNAHRDGIAVREIPSELIRAVMGTRDDSSTISVRQARHMDPTGGAISPKERLRLDVSALLQRPLIRAVSRDICEKFVSQYPCEPTNRPGRRASDLTGQSSEKRTMCSISFLRQPNRHPTTYFLPLNGA